jgi:hypothetical protein
MSDCPKKNEGLNVNRVIRVYKEMARQVTAAPFSSNFLSLILILLSAIPV